MTSLSQKFENIKNDEKCPVRCFVLPSIAKNTVEV